LIKAVVFDFDGLIIDTESVWYQAYKQALSEQGCELPLEIFAKVIGTNDHELLHFIRSSLGEGVSIPDIQSRSKQAFEQLMTAPKLREGVIDYLDEARELGLKVGLASSSTRAWIEGYLTQLGILDRFEVLKTRDDVAEVKPNPELYVEALRSLGVSASEAIAFEDSLNGLRAARAAGMKCVIVPNEVTKHLPFTDYLIRLSSMKERPLREVIVL
jgi:putative hydrolase of the HAD superfamily